MTSQADVNLAESTMDACVMIGMPNRNDVDYTLLFRSRVYPVCSSEYLERNGPITKPRDLRHHALLQVYPSQNDWRVWLNTVGATSVDPSGNARFDSYDHALNTAAGGLGVALAIEPFADEDLRTGRLVEIFPGQRVFLAGQWYFTSLTSRRDDPKIKAFRSWLLDEANMMNVEHTQLVPSPPT